jgi:NitT/TauT family transport system substrate-binding protein
VSLAPVGGDRDRYSALVGGVVQAAVVSNEYLPLPSSKHFKMLVKGGEALPDLVRTCVITTGKTVATHRSDLIRFMTAEIQGFRYAVAHRDATIKLTRDVMEAKPDDPRPAVVFDEAVGGSEVAPNLPIPMAKLAWMQDEMIKLGQVSKPVDLKKMIAPGVRAAALQRAGTS